MANGRGPESTDFRNIGGLPVDQHSQFEQRFADIDRRRRDLEARRNREMFAFDEAQQQLQGAQRDSIRGAEASALMPVYSVMGRTGLAGAYSGGATQAAAQGAMQGALRGAQVRSTFADRVAQQEMSLAQRESELDTMATDIEVAKTALDEEAVAAVDQSIADTSKGLREENWMDVNYFQALLDEAARHPAGSRQRNAFIDLAQRVADADTTTKIFISTAGSGYGDLLRSGLTVTERQARNREAAGL